LGSEERIPLAPLDRGRTRAYKAPRRADVGTGCIPRFQRRWSTGGSVQPSEFVIRSLGAKTTYESQVRAAVDRNIAGVRKASRFSRRGGWLQVLPVPAAPVEYARARLPAARADCGCDAVT